MATLKLGTTSTFVTSINRTPPLSPVRRANGRQPVAAAAEGTATGTAAMQQQWLVEQEEKGRTPGGQEEGRTGGPQCWRNERKKDSSPRRLYAALSFSRGSPSHPSRPPFPCPAFSCELARRAHGEQTGFAIKRISYLEMRGTQREDLTYNAQTGSRSFHFSFTFRTISFVRDSPFLSLIDPSERDVERRDD